MTGELFWLYCIYIGNHQLSGKVPFLFAIPFLRRMEWCMKEEVPCGQAMALCSWDRISKCGRLGTRKKNGPCQLHSSVMESAQLQGNSSPPRTLYRGCPHQHATSQFPLTGSSINTWLIRHDFQDLRVSARGMPIHMEGLLLRREWFRGLPLQLAGSGMIVRGLEWFGCEEQQAVI